MNDQPFKIEEEKKLPIRRLFSLVLMVMIAIVVTGYPILMYYKSRVEAKNDEIEGLEYQINSISDRIDVTQEAIDALNTESE